jgi:O-acetyl-ADP-ribose deacetylase (regulator of RNase III)
MGKGIAKTFKEIYPEMFERYVKLCEAKQFDIGNLWLYKTEYKWVLNFPTKKHWRNPSDLAFIEKGLQKFVETYAQENITSIAFPQLGCGNGELDWKDVEPLMVRYLRGLPINVYLYLYDRDSNKPVEHKDIIEMRRWLRSEPRTLAFAEFWNDVKEVIRSQATFSRPKNGHHYTAEAVKFDQEGLLLYFGSRTWFESFRDSLRKLANQALQKWRFTSNRGIFIPEDSLLELWQSIRFYGFCYSQTMPPGLELLTDYLLPILSKLPYLRPVKLAAPAANGAELEDGLQLYAPGPVSQPKREAVAAMPA